MKITSIVPMIVPLDGHDLFYFACEYGVAADTAVILHSICSLSFWLNRLL